MDFKNLVNSSANANCEYSNHTKSETILIYVKKLIQHYEQPEIRERMKKEPQLCVQEAFEKFNDFFIKYPSLAKMVSEDPYHFDMNRLLDMLNLKNKVSNKEISYQDASTGLGYKYYDEFVKPNLKSTDDN
tara:strand:- start:622 stop:1014 length:393 start_codon:yes stop_codon:yes gene_type:complete